MTEINIQEIRLYKLKLIDLVRNKDDDLVVFCIGHLLTSNFEREMQSVEEMLEYCDSKFKEIRTIKQCKDTSYKFVESDDGLIFEVTYYKQ